MPEDSLHFQQVDACFDQVGGIGMAQTVWRNSFFKPQSRVTWRKVVWMPPRSSGVVARWAFLSPYLRLGKSNAGLRWVCQKRRNICKVFSGNGTKRSRLPLAFRTCTRIRSASMSQVCKRKLAVGEFVNLQPEALNCRAFSSVEHACLQAGCAAQLWHEAAKSTDFKYNVSLAKPPN